MKSETTKCEKCPHASRTLVGNDLWDFKCRLGESPKSCKKEREQMKKAVLISIKPEWVAEILNQRKTIEVRKTAPKCDLPIDVYIYCTEPNAKETLSLFAKEAREHHGRVVEFIERKRVDNPDMRWSICNGKVVAKFTLRKVERFIQGLNEDEYERLPNFALQDYDYYGLDCLMEKACLNDEEINEYAPDLSFYAWHIEDLFIFNEPKKLNGKAPRSWQYIEVE